MEFYSDIAHKLFINKTEIDGTFFNDPFEFIEEKHKMAQYKGAVFYSNLLHALPDHFGAKMKPKLFEELADYCGKKISAYKNSTPQRSSTAAITVPDKISRELQMIDAIFRSQFSSYDPTNQIPYPTILNAQGKSGINGRFISSIDIYSTDPLFELQAFKEHFTTRLENAVNLSLLKSQLLEIANKAISVRDFYNEQLTQKSAIVKQFRAGGQLSFEEEENKRIAHSAVITILGQHIGEIYLGVDRSNIPRRLINSDKYAFTYLSRNQELAQICQQLLDFIDKCAVVPTKGKQKAVKTEPIDKLSTIFFDPRIYKQAIALLRDLGLIDQECRNIAGSTLKGAIQVWVSVLRNRKIRPVSDQDLTILLNRQFPGLHLGEKTNGKHLRNVNKTAEKKYKAKFTEGLT